MDCFRRRGHRKNVLEILTWFDKVGWPYLEKYSDIATALEALSGDDKNSWLHIPFHGARAKRAIGLAFLLGKKELFTQLVNQKKIFLEQINDSSLGEFMEFAEDLKRKYR